MKSQINPLNLLLILIASLMLITSCKKEEIVEVEDALTVETIEVLNGDAPTEWTDLDLSGVVGKNFAMVTLKVTNFSSTDPLVAIFRQEGDVSDYTIGSDTDNMVSLGIYGTGQAIIYTDANGRIEWKANRVIPTKIEVVAYIK
ncbi:hypothetical protein [Crocinitomix catalasitica]|uniref:hypothetical protein n=1 Tax=Crocinitomix catalasitica TaxID=184607 RepID=UPI00047F3BA5|nr:hypothetical protein [Crocinitomix catalasitica]